MPGSFHLFEGSYPQTVHSIRIHAPPVDAHSICGEVYKAYNVVAVKMLSPRPAFLPGGGLSPSVVQSCAHLVVISHDELDTIQEDSIQGMLQGSEL